MNYSYIYRVLLYSHISIHVIITINCRYIRLTTIKKKQLFVFIVYTNSMSWDLVSIICPAYFKIFWVPCFLIFWIMLWPFTWWYFWFALKMWHPIIGLYILYSNNKPYKNCTFDLRSMHYYLILLSSWAIWLMQTVFGSTCRKWILFRTSLSHI